MAEKTTPIKLTPDQRLRAMRANRFVLEVEIEHLDDLLKYERKEERKKGRYEPSEGAPLPEDLAARFKEKLEDLKNMHVLITDAIAKAEATAQTVAES